MTLLYVSLNFVVASCAPFTTAALKVRLQEGGGKRMSLNLDGKRVKKLERLVKAGVGADQTAVIKRLIDDADYA